MIEELNTAGRLLSSALDRYVAICSSIHKTYFESSSSIIFPELSHIVAQGQLVAAMELKLRTAKCTIARAHNSSPSLVPMHTLPTELMERIFLFVPEVTGSRVVRYKRPEILSQVCSKWRNIALALPSLWRLISIPFSGDDVDATRVKRGLEFASRAHPLLLDVFFHNQTGSSSFYPPTDVDHLIPFAQNIAPRTRSLELLFDSERDITDYHTILETCFNSCKPGVLKTLTIAYSNGEDGRYPTILINGSTRVPEYMVSSCQFIQVSYLEDLLEGITVLRLQGAFPFWTSQAYHGLVELHLSHLEDNDGSHTPPISEEHLRGILHASPSLKILHFSLGFAGPVFTDADVVPIQLDHLEVLKVSDIDPDMLGTLLRWISPGSRALRFAISELDELTLSPLKNADVRSFFSRSNVTEIYAESMNYSNAFELLDLCPRLRTLVWSNFEFSAPSRLARARFPISHPLLESLFIEGIIDRESFPSLIGESSKLRSVVFSDTRIEASFIDRLKAMSGISDVVCGHWCHDW